MKMRIVNFLFVCCLLAMTQCDQRPQSKNPGRSNDVLPKLTTRVPDSAAISKPAGGGPLDNDLSIRKRSEGGAVYSETHPEPWLHLWEPAGRPASDLKVIFGEPDSETTEMISYHWTGLVFSFTLKDGKIDTLERRFGDVPPQLGNLIRNRSGADAIKARPFLEAWLSYWDPIGCTPTQLKAAIGGPDGESSDNISYTFDTGFGGCSFEFKLEDGRIASIKRMSID